MLLTGSKMGLDRFLKWITVDTSLGVYDVYKAHLME